MVPEIESSSTACQGIVSIIQCTIVICTQLFANISIKQYDPVKVTEIF